MRRSLERILLALSLCLTIIFALNTTYPLTSALAASSTITLSPRVGPPTTKVKISGAGFGNREKVIISFDTSQLRSIMTTLSGTYVTSIAIPASASPGAHSIESVGQTSGLTAQTTFLVQTNWPQFGFDSSHTRSNPYENVLNTTTVPHLALDWSTASSYIGYSSPVFYNGIVYVGSYDNALHAYDASTGKLLWTAMTGDRIDSTPAVFNNVVYVAADQLYAFNAKTGALLWFGATGNMDLGYIESSPTVYKGVVYVGSTSKYLYAFNATGCGSASCHPIWTTNTSNTIVSSPVVANGIVYVNAGSYLSTFNATTGALLWSVNVPSTTYAWSSPVVAINSVYVCDNDTIYAFRATDGLALWTTSIGDLVYIASSPAIANGTLFVGSDDSNLYAFNASSGVLQWKTNTGGRLESSPTVTNGVVYIGSDLDYKINAFDATTGAPLWSYTTMNRIYSSPTVVNGTVYIGSDSLYAFHIPT